MKRSTSQGQLMTHKVGSQKQNKLTSSLLKIDVGYEDKSV